MLLNCKDWHHCPDTFKLLTYTLPDIFHKNLFKLVNMLLVHQESVSAGTVPHEDYMALPLKLPLPADRSISRIINSRSFQHFSKGSKDFNLHQQTMLTIADTDRIMSILSILDGNSITSSGLSSRSTESKLSTNSRLYTFIASADPTLSFIDLSLLLDEPVEELISMANYLHSWGLAEVVQVFTMSSIFQVKEDAPCEVDSQAALVFQNLLDTFIPRKTSDGSLIPSPRYRSIIARSAASAAMSRQSIGGGGGNGTSGSSSSSSNHYHNHHRDGALPPMAGVSSPSGSSSHGATPSALEYHSSHNHGYSNGHSHSHEQPITSYNQSKQPNTIKRNSLQGGGSSSTSPQYNGSQVVPASPKPTPFPLRKPLSIGMTGTDVNNQSSLRRQNTTNNTNNTNSSSHGSNGMNQDKAVRNHLPFPSSSLGDVTASSLSTHGDTTPEQDRLRDGIVSLKLLPETEKPSAVSAAKVLSLPLVLSWIDGARRLTDIMDQMPEPLVDYTIDILVFLLR